jgi:hypothetical protein
MRPATIATLVLCLAVAPGTPPCSGASLTPTQENLTTLSIASSNDLLNLAAFLPPGQAATTLQGSGSISSSGWSWTTTGTYLGSALALSYAGSFDSSTDTSSWTATGTYGTAAWSSAGSANFQTGQFAASGTLGDPDPFTVSLSLTVDTQGGGWTVGVNGSGSNKHDTSTYEAQFKYSSTSDSWSGTASYDVKILKEEDLKLTVGYEAKGANAGTTTATISLKQLPEPSSWYLLGVGLVGLLGFGCRCGTDRGQRVLMTSQR